MNEHSGATASIWMQTADLPQPPALTEDIEAEICVVGAGIAGLTTAYLLTREGKSVVVIDDGPIAGGETERTTAHLSNALDDRYSRLEQLHGREGASLAADSHTAAITQIELIVREENIDCDFERLDGYLFLPPGQSVDELDREIEAAHRAGLTSVVRLSRAPLADFDTGPCLRFPNQAQFHPLKYLRALALAIQRNGGKIFTSAHAENISGGSPATVELSTGRKIVSQAIVVATNTPVHDRVVIHTKQAPYRTYVIAARVPAGSVPKALYWDTAQTAEEAEHEESAPYHYVRLQSLRDQTDALGAFDCLIIGGEDHKTGQADDAEARWARLEAWARERFPTMEEIQYRWSGQVMEPVDGLAFIGRGPGDQENVFIATGDSGHGMTHGTIAGMLLTDLISGRENPWTGLYNPSRITMRAGRQFASENLNVLRRYADYVAPGTVESVDQLPPGEGAVMRRGLKKVAVYRSPEGDLHECSAVCPHLGCIVHWNHGESTWDCPCHGSRFSKYGEVINGPAISNLKSLSEYAPAH